MRSKDKTRRKPNQTNQRATSAKLRLRNRPIASHLADAGADKEQYESRLLKLKLKLDSANGTEQCVERWTCRTRIVSYSELLLFSSLTGERAKETTAAAATQRSFSVVAVLLAVLTRLTVMSSKDWRGKTRTWTLLERNGYNQRLAFHADRDSRRHAPKDSLVPPIFHTITNCPILRQSSFVGERHQAFFFLLFWCWCFPW